ncbi:MULTISPECIES: recombinase family protein [unclassified Nitratiruptor]|uniref:recombinase family protein n=1 Tax=unclassified Nitratiruptor TaxID=2624044 RepID=UPI0019153E94|nr:MULTISPECIES: recombinase family protein [unclassified Nitratiruptor]BCD59409.1 hypothetical protein NitYY0810_C0145 [Nitratiruptor sp. YY08-10]BCD63333.1 hypothetical protein NitYY0814_C0145 [Nitratiruptor sp. YY08-14]
MDYIYMRSHIEKYSIAIQEKSIQEYLHSHNIKEAVTYTESAPTSKKLDERKELKEFIHSLTAGDRLFIYDLRVISQRVGEVVQFLNCIFNHNLQLIVTKYAVRIQKETPAYVVVSLLNQLRQENRNEPMHKGRPKGSLSKSKFDAFRDTIIMMLKEGYSVSQIAKKIGASRSSIRDYITSRELDKIVQGEISSLKLPHISCEINNKG